MSKSDLHTKTVASIYRLFWTMLDTAVDDGLLRTNPVHIRGAAVERSIERPTLGPPKSAAAHRTVVIPTGVAEMLAAHIEEHVADEPNALVFTSVKDSPLVNRYLARYWK